MVVPITKNPNINVKLVENNLQKIPQKKYKTSETLELIDALLVEKISLAGIARVAKVSTTWLPKYVNKKYAQTPRKVKVSEKQKGKITIECSQMHSFVQKKSNKQWIWLALDTNTKEIVGAYIGKRDKGAAQKLWDSLPSVYRRRCSLLH